MDKKIRLKADSVGAAFSFGRFFPGITIERSEMVIPSLYFLSAMHKNYTVGAAFSFGRFSPGITIERSEMVIPSLYFVRE